MLQLFIVTARREWQAEELPAWLNEETYISKVQPALPQVARSTIASALGVSKVSPAKFARANARRIDGIGRRSQNWPESTQRLAPRALQFFMAGRARAAVALKEAIGRRPEGGSRLKVFL